jgi:hypothetical protein
MKKHFVRSITVGIGACALALFVFCMDFPTQIGYIGEEYVQTVGFVFTPNVEAAPGDTVRLHAYFAGEPVRSYKCSLSVNYSMTTYGSDTAFNFKEISPINEIVAPESICFSFVIPPDFFESNLSVFESVFAKIPDSMKSNLPSGMTPAQIIQFGRQILTQTDFSTADSATCAMTAQLSNLLSGKAVIHLAVNGGYTITRTFTVRYNSQVKNNPLVLVNHNPDPFWMGIYKIKNRANMYTFSPVKMDSTDTLFCLFTKDTSAMSRPCRFTDTILIDEGYTYYMAADSGIVTRPKNGAPVTDTLLERGLSNSGTLGYETYSYLWFCQADTAEFRNGNTQNLMIINNGGGYYNNIAPPLDTAIHNVAIWLRMSDFFPNGGTRPSAVTVTQTHVVLAYTPGYAASAKKK